LKTDKISNWRVGRYALTRCKASECAPDSGSIKIYDPHVIEDLAQYFGIRNLVVATRTSLRQDPQG
jgi:hypothetical protein